MKRTFQIDVGKRNSEEVLRYVRNIIRKNRIKGRATCPDCNCEPMPCLTCHSTGEIPHPDWLDELFGRNLNV